jgi:hypothetical protein
MEKLGSSERKGFLLARDQKRVLDSGEIAEERTHHT